MLREVFIGTNCTISNFSPQESFLWVCFSEKECPQKLIPQPKFVPCFWEYKTLSATETMRSCTTFGMPWVSYGTNHSNLVGNACFAYHFTLFEKRLLCSSKILMLFRSFQQSLIQISLCLKICLNAATKKQSPVKYQNWFHYYHDFSWNFQCLQNSFEQKATHNL